MPVLPDVATPGPLTMSGKSPAVFLLGRFTRSKSNWKLEDGETSEGMEGEDTEGAMGSLRVGILMRKDLALRCSKGAPASTAEN